MLIRRGPGLSVMRHIRQAVAVLEMAVRRAKALGRAVHHGREAADRTADAFRKGDSDVVRRRDELHRRTRLRPAGRGKAHISNTSCRDREAFLRVSPWPLLQRSAKEEMAAIGSL